MKDDVLVWLDSGRGQYLPKAFAECWKDRDATVKGVHSEDWQILEKGPEHEHYWEAFDSVLDHAKCHLDEGKPYIPFLTDNGDLLLVRQGWRECEDCGEWYDTAPEDADDFRCSVCIEKENDFA